MNYPLTICGSMYMAITYIRTLWQQCDIMDTRGYALVECNGPCGICATECDILASPLCSNDY